MQGIYDEIRKLAREIVRTAPVPSFYRECGVFLEKSAAFFRTDAQVARIREAVERLLAEDWGHGMGHSRKVALEAGALVLMEGQEAGLDPESLVRLLRLAQCAGLVHDICRREQDHAARGAVMARTLLEAEGFSERDAGSVCEAVRRHEAFRDYPETLSPEVSLLSACLYDADKFRWGPDNFTHTVWAMLEAARVPVAAFLRRYPEGIAGVARIRGTFRSANGRRFGPEFIDIGMGIAARVYVVLMERYGEKKGQ